jgi:hypothetical protein
VGFHLPFVAQYAYKILLISVQPLTRNIIMHAHRILANGAILHVRTSHIRHIGILNLENYCVGFLTGVFYPNIDNKFNENTCSDSRGIKSLQTDVPGEEMFFVYIWHKNI